MTEATETYTQQQIAEKLVRVLGVITPRIKGNEERLQFLKDTGASLFGGEELKAAKLGDVAEVGMVLSSVRAVILREFPFLRA